MSRDQSPALPATIDVYFRPFACNGTDWSNIPSVWKESVNLIDVNLVTNDGGSSSSDSIGNMGSCALAIRDTANAIYNAPATILSGPGTTKPANWMKLEELAQKIAYDFWSWRLTAFDEVYNGIIAPDLDGLTDRIIWTYDADNCHTRRISAPWDSGTEYLNHSDVVSNCPNCVKILAPVAEGVVLTGARAVHNLCQEGDQLVLHELGTTVPNCCPGGHCGSFVGELICTSCGYTQERSGLDGTLTYTPIEGGVTKHTLVPGGSCDPAGTYTYSLTSPLLGTQTGTFTKLSISSIVTFTFVMDGNPNCPCDAPGSVTLSSGNSDCGIYVPQGTIIGCMAPPLPYYYDNQRIVSYSPGQVGFFSGIISKPYGTTCDGLLFLAPYFFELKCDVTFYNNEVQAYYILYVRSAGPAVGGSASYAFFEVESGSFLAVSQLDSFLCDGTPCSTTLTLS